MKTWLQLLAASLLISALGSRAFAEEPRYLIRAYRFNPNVVIETGDAIQSAADSNDCPLRDAGVALANGTLKANGAGARFVNGELTWGDGCDANGMVAQTFHFLPLVRRDPSAAPQNVVPGIALHDPIDDQVIPFDPADAEYLAPRGDGSYQIQRVDPPAGLTVSLSISAPGRLHIEIAQTVALGREPFPGSALNVGKPIMKSCTTTGELVATPDGNYAGVLNLVSAETCLLVIAPAPPPVSRVVSNAPAFSTEIRILRLDDDALIRDPRCHAIDDVGNIEGARAFQLEPALWEELSQDRFPGELLSAPRLTLPDAALPPKEGDSLFKIVIRGPMPAPNSHGSVFGGTNPRENNGWDNILRPFIAWFGGDSARFISLASVKGGGVIIDNSNAGGAQPGGFGGCEGCVDPPPAFSPTGTAYVGVIRCASTNRADTIKRELYLAIRSRDGENEPTRSFHVEATALLDVPYAFVPKTQTDKGWNAFLVKTTKIEAGQSAFFDVASGSTGAK